MRQLGFTYRHCVANYDVERRQLELAFHDRLVVAVVPFWLQAG